MGDRLIAFALGTANLVLLLLAVLLTPGPRGALLGALDAGSAVAGLLVFGGLWLAVWWQTAAALRRLPPDRLPEWWRVWALGMQHGGVTGAVVFAAPVVASVAVALARGEAHDAFMIVAVYGAIGSLVAFLVGAAVGLVLASVIRLLAELAVAVEP